MDMKKILENMDAAAVGNKPFKGDPNFNDMKQILEGFHRVSSEEIVNDTKQQITESATMNINMTADNAQQVGELMALMRNAGMDPKPVSADMPMSAPNANKFSQAAQDDPRIPGRDDVPGDQDLRAGAVGSGIGSGVGSAIAGGVGGPLGALAGGGGLGGAAGAALGGMAGGPVGAAIGGAIGGALNNNDHDDPNIPGKDEVPGDQDLQAGQVGSLAGGLLGGAAGQVAGAGVGQALGTAGSALGGAVGGPVGAAIGGAAGRAIPALAGSVVGSKIGDKLTGEEYANEPDEEYAPYSDMVKGGNDLNKSKKSYPKVAGGDNPMALKNKIKEELTNLYSKYKQES